MRRPPNPPAPPGQGSANRGGEVLIEMIQNGAYLKVTAVDARSGLEASVIGPAAGGGYALRQLAVRKLERMLTQLAGG